MADVTISQLTKGTPSGNNTIPFSNGSSTLGASVSAILEGTNKVGIGVNPNLFNNSLVIKGVDSPTFTGNQPLGLGLLNGGNYDLTGIDFKNLTGNSLAGRIGVEVTGAGGYMKFGTSNDYSTGITNTAITIDPYGRINIPLQPAFSARGYSSSAGVIGVYSGNILGIRWNTVEINTGNNFNNTTGLFTAPVDGRYVYNLSLNRKANGADWQGAYVTLNNSTILRNAWDPPVNNQQYGPMSISGIVSLNAGNTVGFGYHSNYSAPQTVADSLTENSAYIYLLG